MIKLIIFDFDDTITDNNKLDFESFKTTCNSFNIKNPLSLKKLIYFRKKSYTAKDILKFIKITSNKTFSIKNLIEFRNNFLADSVSNDYLEVKSDTKLVLKTLKKNKIPIILCSVRKNKQLVINFLKKNYIEHYFTMILCSSDLPVKIDNQNSHNRILIKSSLLKKIIKKFKFEHDEILYIGNSFEDKNASSLYRINFLKFNNYYLPEEKHNYQFSTNTMKNLNKIIKELIVKND